MNEPYKVFTNNFFLQNSDYSQIDSKQLLHSYKKITK